MPRGGYEQHRINDDRPTKKKPCHEATIILDFHCKNSNGRVVFTSELDNVAGDVVTQTTAGAGQGPANVSINSDCIVKIVLKNITDKADQKWWRFSDQFDAVTTKEELRDFYGDLRYLPDNAIRLIEGDDDSEIIGYRAISFKVKHNKYGRQGSSHGFSINVDLLQTDPTDPKNTVRSEWQWLPITIDPEIKNPPPGTDPGLAPPTGPTPLV